MWKTLKFQWPWHNSILPYCMYIFTVESTDFRLVCNSESTMNSLTCRLFLYCGKTIACFLCSIALHLSVCTVQPYRSPLQQCIVGWEEPPSKTQAAMHSSTMAHWYQLHHNFITSSSLWILLTLTFYRDWQHRSRDAWRCQHLNPFRFRPPIQ